jgi:hypothetical protein
MKNIQLYISVISDCNNEHKHGGWIDLNNTPRKDFYKKVYEILKNSPTPNDKKWEITESKNLPFNSSFSVEELTSLDLSLMHIFIDALYDYIKITNNYNDEDVEVATGLSNNLAELKKYLGFITYEGSEEDEDFC